MKADRLLQAKRTKTENILIQSYNIGVKNQQEGI